MKFIFYFYLRQEFDEIDATFQDPLLLNNHVPLSLLRASQPPTIDQRKSTIGDQITIPAPASSIQV